MVKNTLGDLNNFLFVQLERLDNPEMSSEELQQEIQRSKAIVSVSSQIISNANTVLEAQRFVSETIGRSKVEVPKMLEG